MTIVKERCSNWRRYRTGVRNIKICGNFYALLARR